ncbi:mitogen-activated protein kinase kinase kinase 18-like [Pistacia vera]|uniref:mitogen-activated protein kinase kinase kinase 18-like n=1 Tax=Pistacia vera TaxID=55513 RepID=UPI001263E3D2|nr:mitogen-activated protein kinase kinase kinase 18-like [Pistacia vera]
MNWTRGRIIGRGSSAAVSIATDDRTGEVFAVKSAEVSNSELLKREQGILSTLMCPQIVAYKGCDISSENGKLLYNLFLEYAPGGTLIDAIHQRGGGGRLDEARIRSYTRAMLQGLEYLHCNGIVHCDIKGQNVLVSNDGQAKICDLGCARRVDEVSRDDWRSTMPISGTPIYMAPEVARGEEQDFPADVWALGCTVVEMATGQAPWVNLSDPVSALYRIGFSSDVPEIPRFMSKQGKDFVERCLKRDPLERWSASELLKHDFVNKLDSFLTEIDINELETPTSVLDQGFWHSMEEGLETTWNSTQKSNSTSPKERIRQLSEGSSEMLNWTWDETWVTVRRSNSSKEPEAATVSQNCFLSCENEATSSRGGDSIWVLQEYISDIPNEPIRITEITTCNSNSSKHEKSSLMPCKCVNGRLRRTLTLIKKVVCLSIIYTFSTKSSLTLVFCPTFKLLQEPFIWPYSSQDLNNFF